MLYIFIEGADDEAFFKSVFPMELGQCQYIPYAQMKREKLNNYIKSIKCMPDSSYLLFADADGKSHESRIAELISTYDELECQHIRIVQYEIESWYYAVLNEMQYKKLKMKKYQYDANNITKEQFVAKLARPSDRAYIMARILEVHDLGFAKGRNQTLRTYAELG